MVLVGVVQGMPDMRDSYINLRVKTERLRYESEITHTEVAGLLLARVPTTSDLAYGDRVVLSGLLQAPPDGEEFSYADYLAGQGVYSYIPYAQVAVMERGQGNVFLDWVYMVKANALGRIYRYLPDPEASLMAGILLGIESGIPAPVEKAFQDTGTSHIIAISGFNITIVVGLFMALFGRLLGRRWGTLAAAIGIVLYTLLVGADAAVVRAAIMGGLALGARQLGRRQHGLNSLALAAAAMALFNPHILWDVGFQLSFAATLGLVWYADPLQCRTIVALSRLLPENVVKRITAPLADYLLFTIAAQITTLPLIVYHFHQIPLMTLPANLAILPAQPPIMVVGGLSLLLGKLADPLGQITAYLVYPFVAYTIRVVGWFALIPGTVWLTGQLSLGILLVYYVLLVWLTLRWDAVKGKLPAMKPAFAIAVLGFSAVFVWQAALHRPDGRLHVMVMDVGMGEGVLLQSPTGRLRPDQWWGKALRSSPIVWDAGCLYFTVNWIIWWWPPRRRSRWRRCLGLCRAFSPESVLWAGTPNASGDTRYLQQILVQENIPITSLFSGPNSCFRTGCGVAGAHG